MAMSSAVFYRGLWSRIPVRCAFRFFIATPTMMSSSSITMVISSVKTTSHLAWQHCIRAEFTTVRIPRLWPTRGRRLKPTSMPLCWMA